MAIEFSRILDAVKIPLALSFVFNLVLYIISLSTSVLITGSTGMMNGDISSAASMMGVGIILLLISGANILGNMVLIAYGGFCAAKKGLPLISCVVAGLVMYIVVSIIMFVIGLAASFMLYGTKFLSMYTGQGIEYGWMVPVLIAATCFGGIVLNSIIGAIGGLIGGAK